MEKPSLLHTETIPLRWGDVDMLGHVNNSCYFVYFEQARMSWFISTGFAKSFQNQGPVLVETHASFSKSLIFPANILVKVLLSKIGNSSFTTEYEVVLEHEPDVCCAIGGAKIVWIDYTREASVPLPGELRTLLESYL